MPYVRMVTAKGGDKDDLSVGINLIGILAQSVSS